MKTRVNKNKELHQSIATDTESNVESSDLSHFANRLNAIDDQFNRMNVEKKEERTLEHARQNQSKIEDTLDQEIASVDTQFDTFENAYLKDFLAEVKDYNIKKGYRDLENTSTNIMKDLKLDADKKSRQISDLDLGFGGPQDLNDLESVLSEITKDESQESVVIDESLFKLQPDFEETQIYKAVDHVSREDYVPAKTLEETIAMAVMNMNEDLDEASDEQIITDSDQQDVVDLPSSENSENIDEEILGDVIEAEPDFFAQNDQDSNDDNITRNLLEQTQTMQMKMVNQEKSIEEMSDKMVHTNRLLNGVLSLLMLAIVVVLMFIISNIWKG